MPLSLICALIWLVLANVIAMFPSKRKHWPAAYALLTVGLPLLVWVYVENGILIGVIITVAAGSVLRWPLLFFLRRLGLVRPRA